ncbi:MAG: ATP-binding cassette domain-containing protein [Sedimentisphaerales bacterium]|nr:ATP-binding cassette domain-containing protein [Sedimentisphaerales bacterium]
MENKNIVLEVRNVSHNFGAKYVLWDVNIDVLAGEIVGLVGPSGCGKSTLLRAILGTHPAAHGVITVHGGRSGRELKVVSKANRDCGIVYQKYTLFPFLTALENVAAGLKFDESNLFQRSAGKLMKFNFTSGKMKWSSLRKIHLEKAAALLEKLRLKDAIDKYPRELSGGMRQRVAIAQSLIMKPKILLLDEPFGALDEATREELQTMLLELYEDNVNAKRKGENPPYTIIIVTHELNEAILVGDRVLGLSQHWDSKSAGDPRAINASTIVYDSISPVFLPDQERDYSLFAEQRKEIRDFVFNPDFLPKPGEFKLRFWKQIENREGRGILSLGDKKNE